MQFAQRTPVSSDLSSIKNFLSPDATKAAISSPATAPAAVAALAAAAQVVDPLVQYKSDFAAGKYKDKPWLDPVAQQVYKQFGQPGNESGDIDMAIKTQEQWKTLRPDTISLIDPNSWGKYMLPGTGTQMQDAYKAAGGLNLNSTPSAPAAPTDPKAAAWQAEHDRVSKAWQDNYNAISSAYNAQQAQRSGGGSSSPGVPTNMNALTDWKQTHAWTQGPGGQIIAK